MSAVCVLLVQSSCQSWWGPAEIIPGEDTFTCRATIISLDLGRNSVCGVRHTNSFLCDFRTDEGKSYRADIFTPCVTFPSRGHYQGIACVNLCYVSGMKGELRVGRRSGAVASFIPDDYAELIRNNHEDWAAWHKMENEGNESESPERFFRSSFFSASAESWSADARYRSDSQKPHEAAGW